MKPCRQSPLRGSLRFRRAQPSEAVQPSSDAVHSLQHTCTHVITARYRSADFAWHGGLLPFLQATHLLRDRSAQCLMQFYCPPFLPSFPTTLVASKSLGDGRDCTYTWSKTTANALGPGFSLILQRTFPRHRPFQKVPCSLVQGEYHTTAEHHNFSHQPQAGTKPACLSSPTPSSAAVGEELCFQGAFIPSLRLESCNMSMSTHHSSNGNAWPWKVGRPPAHVV